ncbi:helix-turn-helix protein [Gemmata obscuriglobus]|uniref:XRE family transcriptional regulator n=1 Tax=Gemmata obscuriglobus TaxID=114 RepID=A0A2Z3H657_9BACT|nr:helix-turn-helix transcriptional regulator [Gemmata obscuriglobus]AWM41238.1 XRE family transcriptional regulator [Gemmata obscuriglobus]QEG25419.1 helix-turn-helix protein [Gemmata obscuriglobus]VTR98522.1 transcription regulator containing hth domain : Helix-turn-helix domain protein OS=Planctomyces limnophilus (strain ATCC 43296 / DSM 3776 / IFAM 1008 / 290) GN=Plim_3645 PE=4 SV=1: HTH_3 [Gemmata obscuriglobus UQM 2246]
MPAANQKSMPDSYFGLVRQFPLLCPTSDSELDAALMVIDDLLTQELDEGGEAYLSALTALVHAYEREHHAIPGATPAEVLRELVSANDLTATELAKRAGIALSTVSALMSGKRRPTPEQMASLAGIFKVHPGVFLPTSTLPRQPQ